MKATIGRIQQGVQRRWLQARNNRQIARLAVEIERHAPAAVDARPVAFFNASSRLAWMSQNAAFSLLSSWALRLAGVPVVHFVCAAGMSRCQLGANPDAPHQLPPCQVCVRQSRHLYRGAAAHWFDYRPDADLERALQGLPLAELLRVEWRGLPLAQLVLPSLRWSLRRHDLADDAATRFLLCQFILSAARVAEEFSRFLDDADPRGLVVFNGVSFPEAVARHLAMQRGLWVVTHEVGLRPFSGFFTHRHATAYPIDIPADFELDARQEARLNEYLEKRFQGQFSMAGIRFWQEMRRLDEGLLAKIAAFRQVVPVFTNVIFDTSQIHANVIFSDMFAWLDEVLALIRAHPQTLFVLRAHPDEERPGKQARQSVAGWVQARRAAELPNVVFIPSRQYLSSYELIQRSKFVMVYNSTIGLEAAILGVPVLCAGKARFTQLPTVFLPASVEDFQRTAENFLTTQRINTPPDFQRNARRFLYYQLFKASLPFDAFLEADLMPGFARLRTALGWQDFSPQHSATLRTICDGVLNGQPFLLADGD